MPKSLATAPGALVAALAALAVGTLLLACFNNNTNTGPTTSTQTSQCAAGSTPCAGKCCDPPMTACCARHMKCCSPSYPHHCAETAMCYQYFTDAQAACGNNYEICGGAAGTGALPAGRGLIEGVHAVPESSCGAALD